MTTQPIIIDIKNLNKSFDKKPAVVNFSLKIRQGEICGFLGPNGSGKTTTLRMICGLLTPDSGEGTCLGHDILKEAYAIKRQVGYMTQSFSLYHDLTVYENLDFIARVYQIKDRENTINECIHTLKMEKRRNQLTGGLSGGWKQRLALGGCLLHNPKLLLLDEPTAGVDPKARRDFWDEIHKLSAQGITTLVSTHYMDEAERCTQLAYISHGILLAQGSQADIIDRAKLSTWAVSNDNNFALAEKLKTLPGVEQTAFFGTKIHVSGQDHVLLEQTMREIKDSLTFCEKIEPSLEDVFISLVDSKDPK